jgi:hypothetical protein
LELAVQRDKAGAASSSFSNEISLTGNTYLIYAIGSVGTGNSFSKHSKRGSFIVNFGTGGGSDGGDGVGSSDIMKKVHGILMVVSW